MASKDGSIRTQDPRWNPSSWLPVYGRWCGPDWSAGERGTTKSMPELARERAFQRVGPAGGSKVESPLDLICKEHDLAYLEAESQSGSEAMQKFEADKDLLIKIAALDENLLAECSRPSGGIRGQIRPPYLNSAAFSSSTASAHCASRLPPGAPATPMAPMTLLPALIGTPPPSSR